MTKHAQGRAPRPHGAGQKAHALFRRGAALHGSGQLRQAVAAYQAGVLLAPDHADALRNLAAALTALGRDAEAAAAWERLVRLRPADPAAALGLGQALLAANQPQQALVALTAACRRWPQEPHLLQLHGRVLVALGLRGQAIGAFYMAAELRPGDAGVQAELGTALFDHGQAAAALPHLQAAFQQVPSAEHATTLSCILIDLGRYPEALDVADRGLAQRPGCAEALVNRSIALEALGRGGDAVQAARRAVAAAPGKPPVVHHLAATLLAQGELTREAWEHYEARLLLKHARPWPAALRRWDGGAGQAVLLHAEQGLGDTLQFVRYVPLAAARGVQVVLAVQPSLLRLLQGTAGAHQVVAIGPELPHFDTFLPLLSLPGLLGTTLDTIPPALPYAMPDPPRAPGPLRVGLVWAGGSVFVDDRKRSLPPAALAPLAGVPGVAFHSLQLDAEALPPGLGAVDAMQGVADFANTAERIAGLDLVVSADTAVAHLAATMGKPVWLLSRFRGCWRWLQGREDTPWYPSMRILRQPQPDDWDGVVQQVRRRLLDLAGRPTSLGTAPSPSPPRSSP